VGVGDEIHSDIWGPAPVETINRKEYYVSFTDDHSRFTKIYLLRTKSEAFDSYCSFKAWLQTQHNHPIKKFHTDRGGEYLSNEFSNHLRKTGTIRRLTVHDTPEYNGVTERLNRTLMEKVRAMLHDSQLPRFLWGEALNYAVYVKNRTWTRSLKDSTPFETLTGSKPNLSNMHPWGAKVWVHDTGGTKLDGRAKLGRWVGFDEESAAHRVYWPEKRSVTVERSVRFVDDEEVVVRGVTVPFEGEIPGFDKLDNDNQPFSPQLPIPNPNTQPSSTESSDPTVETGGVEPDTNPPGEPASTDDKGG